MNLMSLNRESFCLTSWGSKAIKGIMNWTLNGNWRTHTILT